MSLVFRGIGRERRGKGAEKSEEEQGGMNHVREFWSLSSKEFNADEARDESEFPRIKSRISRNREEMQTIIFLAVKISQINFFFFFWFFNWSKYLYNDGMKWIYFIFSYFYIYFIMLEIFPILFRYDRDMKINVIWYS